ncbi:MAG: Mrp/NBP35 family ATP-binding protein [Desulfohalobiaceae bacterium]|nr:Mrp/NBP35 family ATP-binding protein [Desulfohalobiaceae bacterium]
MSENQCGSCSSQGSCQDAENKDRKLNAAMCRVKNKIVVLSGKGGVGKSSVAVNIAVGLAQAGKKVGLIDVDVHGPSVPRLLNLSLAKLRAADDSLEPVPWSPNLSVMSLGFLIPNKEDSVIWRGPVKMSLIRQFLEDVTWGDLDYLIVDCPPGTGDEPLSVMQLLGQEARAVIVTTPQDLAVDDVRRSINFCRQTKNPILGVVENMSGFICPHCRETVDIFHSGGGERLARESNIPFLGRIPLDPKMVRAADQGQSLLESDEENPTTRAFRAVIKPLLEISEASEEEKAQP